MAKLRTISRDHILFALTKQTTADATIPYLHQKIWFVTQDGIEKLIWDPELMATEDATKETMRKTMIRTMKKNNDLVDAIAGAATETLFPIARMSKEMLDNLRPGELLRHIKTNGEEEFFTFERIICPRLPVNSVIIGGRTIHDKSLKILCKEGKVFYADELDLARIYHVFYWEELKQKEISEKAKKYYAAIMR